MTGLSLPDLELQRAQRCHLSRRHAAAGMSFCVPGPGSQRLAGTGCGDPAGQCRPARLMPAQRVPGRPEQMGPGLWGVRPEPQTSDGEEAHIPKDAGRLRAVTPHAPSPATALSPSGRRLGSRREPRCLHGFATPAGRALPVMTGVDPAQRMPVKAGQNRGPAALSPRRRFDRLSLCVTSFSAPDAARAADLARLPGRAPTFGVPVLRAPCQHLGATARPCGCTFWDIRLKQPSGQEVLGCVSRQSRSP